jgi:hypothetical protein
MTLRDNPYRTFLVLAILMFPLTLVVAGAVLQSWAHLDFFRKTYSSNSGHPLVVAGLAAYFLAPFFLLGLMCASLAKRRGIRPAMVLLAVGAVLLGATYISGFHDSRTAMAQHAWTAATLSVGLIPFFSVPALFVCVCVS